MAITPGQEPGPATDEPLLAEEPPPPGSQEVVEDVEELDDRIRAEGPDEVEQADREADAVEGDAEDAAEQGEGTTDEPGSAADADRDPTSDQGEDPEDPEAQQGADPVTGAAGADDQGDDESSVASVEEPSA